MKVVLETKVPPTTDPEAGMKLAVIAMAPEVFRVVVSPPEIPSQESNWNPGAGIAVRVASRFGKIGMTPGLRGIPARWTDPDPVTARVMSTAVPMPSSDEISACTLVDRCVV